MQLYLRTRLDFQPTAKESTIGSAGKTMEATVLVTVPVTVMRLRLYRDVPR